MLDLFAVPPDLIKQTGVHQSRNSLIAKVLREMGYMRELGEGIRRIFKLLRDSDLTPPKLVSSNDRFSITLSQQLIYSEPERLWLDNFKAISLTRDEKTVVRLGYNKHIISPKEIWEACGIVDTEYYRQLVESLYQKKIMYKGRDDWDIIKEARQRRIPKKDVARYMIKIPEENDKSVVQTYDEPEYSRVFIRNITENTTQDQLYQTFEKIGDVSDIYLPLNLGTTGNKGYAFIEFDERVSAEKAIGQSGKLNVNGHLLHIDWARPKK